MHQKPPLREHGPLASTPTCGPGAVSPAVHAGFSFSTFQNLATQSGVAWTSSMAPPGSLLEMQISVPTADPLNQTVHFSKMPGVLHAHCSLSTEARPGVSSCSHKFSTTLRKPQHPA